MHLVRVAAALGLLTTSSVAFADDDSSLPNEGAGVIPDQGHRFGLGLGGSTLANGINGKLYLSDNTAIQVGVGYWFGAGISISGDIIFERALYKIPELSIQGYLGAGPSVGFFGVAGAGGAVVGGSAVGGVGLQIAEFPIEVTAEIRPTILVASDVWGGFYIGGGGAIRYYF